MNQVNLNEKLMVAKLNCSYSFGNVTDKAITEETRSNKGTKSLRVTKELFPKESGEKLRKLQFELVKFYQYHKKVTLSSATDGERLLPVAFYLDYNNEFNDARTKIDVAFQEFVNDYDAAILKAQPFLHSAFNAADYPDKGTLGKYLNFHVQLLPLPDAKTLLDVIGESVQADVDTYVQEAAQAAYNDTKNRVRLMLENTVKVLSNPKGRLHDSLFSNMVDMVSFLPEFNVTGEADLVDVGADIKTRLLSHNAAELKDRTKRAEVAMIATEILQKL